ncbi:Lrp/AsnC family transcriptional regulator [Paenibacillus taichungensis]|uniref:Lrp/AsnC family transcriptional regulator n=1 Tax=Paenibacillus taichungensis TaxID=484184 RepID=UPI001C310BFC|nr:Lrp/AsnC family transcriptional regulator [Paenibacillus taichungensis]
MTVLDTIDSHILRRLAQNSRISYTDLAKEVGLSGVAVKERIERLVNQGIIEQFSIVISAEKLGKKISAYLELEVEPKHLDKIVAALKENERVAVLYEMTGACILHTHILVESIEEMEHFMNESIYSLEGLLRVENQILLKRHKNQDGLNI